MARSGVLYVHFFRSQSSLSLSLHGKAILPDFFRGDARFGQTPICCDGITANVSSSIFAAFLRDSISARDIECGFTTVLVIGVYMSWIWYMESHDSFYRMPLSGSYHCRGSLERLIAAVGP